MDQYSDYDSNQLVIYTGYNYEQHSHPNHSSASMDSSEVGMSLDNNYSGLHAQISEHNVLPNDYVAFHPDAVLNVNISQLPLCVS